MIYTLEYLNYDEEVEVITYDETSKELNYFISQGTTEDYVKPQEYDIYFCVMEEGMDEDNAGRNWYQKLATIEVEDGDSALDALEDEDLHKFFTTLIEQSKTVEFEDDVDEKRLH